MTYWCNDTFITWIHQVYEVATLYTLSIYSCLKLMFEYHWIKLWGNYQNKPRFHHSITLYFLLGSWHWKILLVLETVAGKNVYASTNTWDWKEVCHWAAGRMWSFHSTFMYLTPYNVIGFTLYECDTNHIIMWFWQVFFFFSW